MLGCALPAVETPTSFGIICDRRNQPPGPKVKVDRSCWAAMSSVHVIKEGRPDAAILTTRLLVFNETSSPTAANYGSAEMPLVMVHVWSCPLKDSDRENKHGPSLIDGFMFHNFLPRLLALPEARSVDEVSFGAETGDLGSFR